MPTQEQVAEEIFDLRKQINLELQAGSSEKASSLQLKIAELQREHGVTCGSKGGDDERTA